MRALIVCTAVAAVAMFAAAPASAAVRCGWLSNPTPGNWWLDDASGQLIIGVQGGAQAQGIDRIPDMGGKRACACLNVTVKSGRITRITSAKLRPLAKCQNDPAL
jgi:Protein of unknown function (DUF4087)